MPSRVRLGPRALREFCNKHRIRKLALFGSAIRGDFGPESDVDFVVEFEEGHRVSFFDMADMEAELSRMLGGRKVDLRTPQELSARFRDQVVQESEVQYAAG